MARKLNEDEVQAGLHQVPGWSVSDGLLTRTFEFNTYKDGVVFAAYVGYLADLMDHHPDLYVGYRRVTVSLSTHSVNGLSDLDFALAAKL